MYFYRSILFFVFMTFFVSCKNDTKTNTNTTDKTATDSKATNATADFGNKEVLNIVCTTGMIADAVRNITGERAKVQSLMGPGVDPHLYKATQGDLKKINNADIIFYNGLKLEGKMDEVLGKLSKRKPVLAITENFQDSDIIQATYPGTKNASPDPHIWFDVRLWSKAVMNITKNMAQLDAKNAAKYAKNGQVYLDKLNALHDEVKTGIASIPEDQRILITSHDAFTYFGNAYDIDINALQGISTVTEFGLKDITNMVNSIVEKKTKAIFVESSVAPKSLEAVVKGCKGKGHDVKIGGTLFSDAMGEEGTPGGTYIGMIRHNLKTIVNNLK